MVRWVPPDPVAKDWDGVETAERRWRRARVRGGVRVVRGEIRRRLACRAAGAAAAGLGRKGEARRENLSGDLVTWPTVISFLKIFKNHISELQKQLCIQLFISVTCKKIIFKYFIFWDI
jgi:hypothetical protein